ncbi:MAG: WbqC family protein [Chloroherpetonaceae bacterium]|nr:WbqC family protein [Chloroherpetonaceae bacterium]
MRCVIMQPTYLPWMGYFDLIAQSDVFVLLDTVQFEKQSWQQRNRIKTAQGALWLTVPVLRRLESRIHEVQIDPRADLLRKHWGTIEMAYRSTPHFATFAPALRALYEREWTYLAELNCAFIQVLCDLLGVQATLVRASQLPPLPGKREGLIIALCQYFGASEFLSAAGARDYLCDETPFVEAGITLRFHHYCHPVYPQKYGEFMPYLSVIDLLFNAGNQSLNVILSGRRESLPLAGAEGIVMAPEA